VRVRYTRRVLEQLDEIFSYIEVHDPAAAKRVKARIKRSIERLSMFPYSARRTSHADVRVLVISKLPYLVFYTVNEGAQEVQVLRVRHSARDPSRHLD